MKDSFLKKMIIEFDTSLRVVFDVNLDFGRAERPDHNLFDHEALSKDVKEESSRLMRINHVGEICAQALYQGQRLGTSSQTLVQSLARAAEEELDHLYWCRERVYELGGRLSFLVPFWYYSSFVLGFTFALMSDRWSLAFLEETELQVGRHLDSHMEKTRYNDYRTYVILKKMKEDELSHAKMARDLGAMDMPFLLRHFMRGMAFIMVFLTYYI